MQRLSRRSVTALLRSGAARYRNATAPICSSHLLQHAGEENNRSYSKLTSKAAKPSNLPLGLCLILINDFKLQPLSELGPGALFESVTRSGGRFMSLYIDSERIGVTTSDDNLLVWPHDFKITHYFCGGDFWKCDDELLPKLYAYWKRDNELIPKLHAVMVEHSIQGIVVGAPFMYENEQFVEMDHIDSFIEDLKLDGRFHGLRYCFWRNYNTYKVCEYIVEGMDDPPPVHNFAASMTLQDFFSEARKSHRM